MEKGERERELGNEVEGGRKREVKTETKDYNKLLSFGSLK